MVYANIDHTWCVLTEYEAACNNWIKKDNWRFTYPVPVQREDATCESLYRIFLEGPLEDPEVKIQ